MIRLTGDCGLIRGPASGFRYVICHKEQFGQEAEDEQKTIEVSQQVCFGSNQGPLERLEVKECCGFKAPMFVWHSRSLFFLGSPCTLKGRLSQAAMKAELVICSKWQTCLCAIHSAHNEVFADRTQDLAGFIKKQAGCGIVYAHMRTTCDALSSALKDYNLDLPAYHAGRKSAQCLQRTDNQDIYWTVLYRNLEQKI